MKLINIAGGELNSTILTLSDALGDRGEVARDIRTDPAFVERVAKHMLAGAPEQLVRTEGLITAPIAKAIMGNEKVFGPYDIARMTGIELDQSTLTNANVVPYKLGTLMRCGRTHLLVYGLPTTVRAMDEWAPVGLSINIPEEERSTFGSDVPVQGWYLIGREAMIGEEDPSAGVRQATLVEAYLALNLHKKASPRHYFFNSRPALCQLTAQGGEVAFGLGNVFGITSQADGAYSYWAVKTERVARHMKSNPAYVEVILPDDIK